MSAYQDYKSLYSLPQDCKSCGTEEDGDNVPAWLKAGNYTFYYDLIDTATLIKACSELTPLTAISKATGIYPHQLSHYVTGLKKPRPQQREKIVNGLHAIGRELIAVV